MIFNSEAQRLAHPQATLIPKIVLETVFNNELSDTDLMLMQPDSLQNLTRVREAFGAIRNDSFERTRAGACLLYAHPQFGNVLIENAVAFRFSPEDLLLVAVFAERIDMIQAITRLFPEIKNEGLTKSFINASYLGNLTVLEQLIVLAPRMRCRP